MMPSSWRLLRRQTKNRRCIEDSFRASWLSKNYLQTEKPKVLPKSPISDAIDHTLSNWEALLKLHRG
jgi:hypothetical protein